MARTVRSAGSAPGGPSWPSGAKISENRIPASSSDAARGTALFVRYDRNR